MFLRSLFLLTLLILFASPLYSGSQVLEFAGYVEDPITGPYNQRVIMRVEIIKILDDDEDLPLLDRETVIWT